jgi:hypothetical protein
LSENSFNEDDSPDVVRPVMELSYHSETEEPEEQDEPEDHMEAAAAAAAAALVDANREWEGSDSEGGASHSSEDGNDGTPRPRRGSRRASRPLIRRQSLEPAGRENADNFSIAAFWAHKNAGEQLTPAPFPGVTFYNETLPEGQGVAVDEMGAIINGPFPGIKLYTEQSNHRSRSNSLRSSDTDSRDGSAASSLNSSGSGSDAGDERSQLQRTTSLSSLMDSFEIVPIQRNNNNNNSDKQ